MLEIATFIAFLIYAYLFLGLLFSLWFVFRVTRSAPIRGIVTRVMLIPGAMLLWPVLIFKRSSS